MVVGEDVGTLLGTAVGIYVGVDVVGIIVDGFKVGFMLCDE